MSQTTVIFMKPYHWLEVGTDFFYPLLASVKILVGQKISGLWTWTSVPGCWFSGSWNTFHPTSASALFIPFYLFLSPLQGRRTAMFYFYCLQCKLSAAHTLPWFWPVPQVCSLKKKNKPYKNEGFCLPPPLPPSAGRFFIYGLMLFLISSY